MTLTGTVFLLKVCGMFQVYAFAVLLDIYKPLVYICKGGGNVFRLQMDAYYAVPSILVAPIHGSCPSVPHFTFFISDVLRGFA